MKGRLVTHLRSFQYLSTWAAEQREEEGRWEKMVSMTSGGSSSTLSTWGAPAEMSYCEVAMLILAFKSVTKRGVPLQQV